MFCILPPYVLAFTFRSPIDALECTVQVMHKCAKFVCLATFQDYKAYKAKQKICVFLVTDCPQV